MRTELDLVLGTVVFCEVDVAVCKAAPEATASIDEFLGRLLHGRRSISQGVVLRPALVDAVVRVRLLNPVHRHRAIETMI